MTQSSRAGAVLVTGAAGFIGSHAAAALASTGRRVVGLDNLDPYYDPAIKRRNLSDLAAVSGFKHVEGDIRDRDLVRRLFRDERIDEVVHLAAKAGVRPSIEDPALYADVNVTGTAVLLDVAQRSGVRAFVMASSSSVYGARTDAPFRESDPPAVAISPYACSKQACELLGKTFAALHGMDVTALRFFNAYGPRQRPDMAIHKFSAQMLAGKPIPFYGDGSMRRDHTYVADVVAGVVRALDHAHGRGYRVYNLGNSVTVSLNDLVAALERVWGVRAVLEHLPASPGDVPLTCADGTLAADEIGYRPTTSLDVGVRLFAAWYQGLRT
ncbi:MAG: GDP-mannose 4,6-dehydratase [Planctomycetes bacterium]|nr:GDP-mannose 4,6-dehydratase [Planctomycetota bacterium]